MYELTLNDCQDVAGGFGALAGAMAIVSVISASGPLYDFVSGVLDGFNKL